MHSIRPSSTDLRDLAVSSMPRLLLPLLHLLFLTLPAHAQRDTIPLNTDWRFAIGSDVPQKEPWKGRPMPHAHTVQVPHTWNVEEAHQHHYGWAWYQRSVIVPAEWKTRYVTLEFGAVNHSAIVYFNGKKVGEHLGDGFNKFSIAMNGKLRYGKENLLTVLVNNAYAGDKLPHGSSFDWPNDGGIIRPVRLIVSGSPHVQHLQATPTLQLADSAGQLHLQAVFDHAADIRLGVRITEENQPTTKVVLERELVPTWQGAVATVDLDLGKVNPWHFDRPNLYRVEVKVWKGADNVDAVTTNVGFRTVEIRDGQVHLNGEAVKLMGVEWTAGSNPDFGLAEPDSLIRAMGRLMKEVNCIFSRQHFQQGDVFFDFCDRHGILVQQELPLWGPETPANDTAQDIAMRQLEAMIVNLGSHPSILAWGVGNELRARDPRMSRMIKALLDRARELDPTRYATYVSNSLTESYAGEPGFVPDAAAHGDLLMMNEYGGSWWELPTGAVGLHLDSIHATYPTLPFFISEFGLCEPNFAGGDARRIHDLIYHHALYESKPYIQGAIYFDLTDYRTHYPGTSEPGRFRRRVHGVYDMYGKPKPSMEVLRDLSSPIEIHSLRGGTSGKLNVLLFGNIGLPQHTASGYVLHLSDSMGEWRNTRAYPLPDIRPGQRVMVEVDDLYQGKGVVTIVRPTGTVATRKSFYPAP